MTQLWRFRSLGRHLAILPILASFAAAPVVGAAPTIDRPAPALIVATLNGATFDLAAERGHVVIVNFWATWCPPCRGEMALLDAYLKEHQAQDLVIIGVSVDRRRDRSDVVGAMRPFAYVAGLADGAKANGFGQPQALPITYVVDVAGVLRAAILPGKGALTEAMLDAAVLPLLAPKELEKGQSRDQRVPDPVP